MNTAFETNQNKEDWITPPEIVKALGEFDLDPCACSDSFKQYAPQIYTKHQNGLNEKWRGRVWCNPPYGKKAEQFLAKMAQHNNGIALIFARTETKTWFDNIWGNADALFFIRGRLRFYYPNGKRGQSAGSPSVLVAYGKVNADILRNCKIKGQFVELRK